jgi:hypothetical protein
MTRQPPLCFLICAGLVLIAAIGTIGVVVLAWAGKEQPPALAVTIGTALGALAGALAVAPLTRSTQNAGQSDPGTVSRVEVPTR